MLHIGGQIDIMQQEVGEIRAKDKEYDLPMTFMRSLITKHHKIIAFSESIERLFSHIALLQFFSNTMIICCIGFLIVTVSIRDLQCLFEISIFMYRTWDFLYCANYHALWKLMREDMHIMSENCNIHTCILDVNFYKRWQMTILTLNLIL